MRVWYSASRGYSAKEKKKKISERKCIYLGDESVGGCCVIQPELLVLGFVFSRRCAKILEGSRSRRRLSRDVSTTSVIYDDEFRSLYESLDWEYWHSTMAATTSATTSANPTSSIVLSPAGSGSTLAAVKTTRFVDHGDLQRRWQDVDGAGPVAAAGCNLDMVDGLMGRSLVIQFTAAAAADDAGQSLRPRKYVPYFSPHGSAILDLGS